MRIYVVVFALIIILVANVFSQTKGFTRRVENEVREGPGNYYTLLYMLPQHVPLTIVATEGSWVKCKFGVDTFHDHSFPSMVGWVSRNCLVEKLPNKQKKDLKFEKISPDATPASVAAAIRGFALHYGQKSPASLDSILNFTRAAISPKEYEKFRSESGAVSRSQSKTMKSLNTPGMEYTISNEERGIGLAALARAVTPSAIVVEPKVVNYINYLGNVIVEASEAYDVPFTFIVTHDDRVNAVAIPGGYIVITDALLKLCADEAELAGALAHELTHLLNRHGVKEIAQRLSTIRMDEVMQELDRRSDRKSSAVELELENFSNAAFETIVKPRIQAYEEEADGGAAILLANAGYDPRGVSRLIGKIKNHIRSNRDLEFENPFAGIDFEKREKNVESFIKNTIPERRWFTNKQRLAVSLQ